MGINGTLHQVTPLQLKQMLNDHKLVDKWIFYGRKNPKMMIDSGLDLSRSLYALHFIITGDEVGGDPPECYAIFGKNILFHDEFGITSCSYLTPGEVKEVWSALSRMTEEALRTTFDPDLMTEMEVYPPGRWIESDFDDLYELFGKLVAYYKVTVRNKNAMIHVVN